MNSNTKYQNIQLLRIFSCLGVLFIHTLRVDNAITILDKVAGHGALGVYMFFIISGFVTFLSMDRKLPTVYKYYVGRFIRIMPLYYFTIIVHFIINLLVIHETSIDYLHLGWLRYFLCLNIVIPVFNCTSYKIGYGLWTIYIFMAFYLLAPLLKRYCNSLKKSVIAWVILLGVSFISIPAIDTNVFPLFKLHYLVLGVVVYYAIKEEKEQMLVLVCGLIILGRMIIYPAFDMIVIISLFVIIVVSSRNISITNHFVIKIINICDKYTYHCYLLHPILMTLTNLYILQKFNIDNRYIYFLCVSIGAFLLSFIVHNFIEKPIQEKLKQILLKSN